MICDNSSNGTVVKAKKAHLLNNWTRETKWVFLCVAWIFPPTVYTQNIAESGSPLYFVTVCESISGLKTRGNEQSGEEGKVCPHCGKVHPPPVNNRTNQVAAATPVAATLPGQPCPVCGQIHSPAQTTAQSNGAPPITTPSLNSVGVIAGKYYYCPKCRVYHQYKPTLSTLSAPLSPVGSVPLVSHTNVEQTGRR